MVLLIILIITEVLTPVVLRQHFYGISRVKYFISIIVHAILSLWLWILFIEVTTYNGIFDDPGHIWLSMNLTGTFCAVIIPRILLDVLHFSGKLIRIRNGGHIRSMTNTGIVIWIIVFSIIVTGTLFGRFNFKTEEITVKVEGLNKEMDGLTIVQLSDIHLSGFHRHNGKLKDVMEKVNGFKPDILINSGDFVNYGWREFDSYDTILSLAKSRFGNFAVLGNHDIGTYFPGYQEEETGTNIARMNELITSSGYKVLNDGNVILTVGKSKLAIIGVITKGRHPDMVWGDLEKAMKGTDSADFRILIIHDPNQWEKEVREKTDIELTLAGHTHGMQMGVYTRWWQWSPAKYFYPRWNGLYKDGEQYLYVNRGLGVLAIPFRIWMPPEITVISIKSE